MCAIDMDIQVQRTAEAPHLGDRYCAGSVVRESRPANQVSGDGAVHGQSTTHDIGAGACKLTTLGQADLLDRKLHVCIIGRNGLATTPGARRARSSHWPATWEQCINKCEHKWERLMNAAEPTGKSQPSLKLTIGIAACVALLAACTTQPQQEVYRYEAFKSGAASQDCDGIQCAVGWGRNASALHALYEAQAWEALAERVINTQYDHDLAYFYLGKSAEGLGLPVAAKAYYSRSSSAAVKCTLGMLNTCRDIDVPSETATALRSLDLDSGMSGQTAMDSVELQSRLAQLGFYDGAIDGVSGPMTESAIRSFQRENDLTPTGDVNQATLIALSKTSTYDAKSSMAAVAKAGEAARSTSSPASSAAAEVIERSNTPNASTRGRALRLLEILAEKDPFAVVVAEAPTGAWVTVVERGEEWTQIEFEGRKGFVYSDSIRF